MRPLSRFLLLLPSATAAALLLSASTPAARAVEAEGVTEDKSAASVHTLKPYDRKSDTTPSDSPAAAQKGFRRAKIPAGFTASLWAAEPLLANPVAFSFDGQGRMYIAETHRYRTSVLDIRHYMFMLEDDLANRNQTDWERSIKKNFPKDWQDLAKESEVVRLVEDTNNDGTADKTTIYADGFNSILDGIASGVLARPDGVWLANIPGLYKLTGQTPDGKAAKKEELLRGFGVRFNYTGHDLHGLIKGPDGRIYFSIGDRGTSVKTKEGPTIGVPDEGAIFRCEEDGTHLELVMRGLRNPQELAFDDYGNLFTCDNDSDQGDRERFVYVVEGGDAGWRVGYQHCPQPAERNPWLAEHMWEPRDPAKNQPAYILSPLANLPDGPGGFVHYPGTGLPDKYKGCFFLACYKGSSLTSQVAVLKPVPDSASFKLERLETFIPGCQATDVDFGPDSRLYVSFWDEGWERTAQGRIMKVEHEEARKTQAAQIAEVQKLLGEGMKKRSSEELVKLLGHKDQRIRLEAQWELAAKILQGGSKNESETAMKALQTAAVTSADRFTRLHAIWAMGQVMRVRLWKRRGTDFKYLEHVPGDPKMAGIFNDPDEAIRAAWLGIYGQLPMPFDKALTQLLCDKLMDESPGVRMAAAQALGFWRGGIHSQGNMAVPALLELARREQNKSQEMRLVIAEALCSCAVANKDAWKALRAAAADTDPSVRMVTLLALGRLMDRALTGDGVSWWENAGYDVSAMLQDKDPAIVREAARLLSGLMIDEPNRALADLGAIEEDKMTTLRMLNANHRRGSYQNAEVLANFAADETHDAGLRTEALRLLGLLSTAVARDQVVGIFRVRRGLTLEDEATTKKAAQRGPRTVQATHAALEHCLKGDATVASAALEAIRRLEGKSLDVPLAGLIAGTQWDAGLRAQALHVLADLQSPLLVGTLQNAIADPNSTVRIAAAGLLGKTDPLAAAKGLETALAQGTPEDARAAFTELTSLTIAEADRILAEQLILLTAGKVPSIARLELLEAAAKHPAPAVKDALAKFESSLPKDDVLAQFAACLEGGNAANGKRLFKEHPVAACQRCHMVEKAGGEAGPPLDGIASRKDRLYMLESILLPNAKIAENFRMVTCTMRDGTYKPGVLRAETPDTVTIQAPGEDPETLKKSDITARDPAPSSMLPNMASLLTKRELRDLVEYVASLKD